MIRFTADATCSLIARDGRSMPAISTIVSSLDRESRGELACRVVSDPSWPVFMAWSMSRASPPRHSPTMMRSGRMRRLLMTSFLMGMAPSPLMFGGLASRLTTCSWGRFSSAASSIVTMRSSGGMKAQTTFRSVVFPEPVPPLITMFWRCLTASSKNCAICRVSVPKETRSSIVNGSEANFLMVSVGPVSARGDMIALTREPSGRRASTMGLDSSMRRPIGEMILRMMLVTCWLSVNRRGVLWIFPCRST